MKVGCQNREGNSLDGKNVIKEALIEPTEDTYDDQRLESCDCDEMPDDLKFQDTFRDKPS